MLNLKEEYDNKNYESKNPNIKLNHYLEFNGNRDLKNNIFEIFISIQNNITHIIIPDNDTNNLKVFFLNENQLQIHKILKAHKYEVTILNYFLTDKKEEYLLSTDSIENIIMWDIKNDFNILTKIETKYEYKMYSNLLLYINNDNYIITSCSLNENDDTDSNVNDSYSRIYSLTNDNLLKNIPGTNLNYTYYILSWYNSISGNIYIIECCKGKIFIYNLSEDELYIEFLNNYNRKANFYEGFIYSKNNDNYLLSGTDNGMIFIWDLNAKMLSNVIFLNQRKYQIYHINKWNENYFYIYEFNQNSIIFIDYEQIKIITCYKFNQNKSIENIKLVKLNAYGKSLFISNEENYIEIWN